MNARRFTMSLVFLLSVAIVGGASCKKQSPPPQEATHTPTEKAVAPAPAPTPKAEVPAPAPTPAPTENAPAPESQRFVKFVTTKGEIVIELDHAKAPATVANFVRYVQDGHYNGVIFHRVINGFMIQGGGFTKDFVEKSTREPIKNEANNGLKNLRGTIAMARTPNPHSASAQFFINVADNASLDHRSPSIEGWGYCVFGKVIKGMEVVDAIKQVATTSHGGHQNVPIDPIVIESASIVDMK